MERNVHILVKSSTKILLNEIRAKMEQNSANRISHDEVVNKLIGIYQKGIGE